MNDQASLIATDHIQVEVTIRLGGTKMSVAEIARLRPDDIVTLNQSMTEGVELCIGDKVIARGELTAVEGEDDRLSVRILGAAQET